MEDVEAIRQLANRMAWFVTGDPIDVSTLWENSTKVMYDVTAMGGPRLEGYQTVVDTMTSYGKGVNPLAGSEGKRSEYKLHLVSNHDIDVTGDRAVGHCAAIGCHRNAAGKTDLVATAFDDTYVRTDTGWRFETRVGRWLVPKQW